MKETRAEMMRIRKESNNDNNAIDDSNLRKQWKEKCSNIFKKIQLNFVIKFRTNKNMNLYNAKCKHYTQKYAAMDKEEQHYTGDWNFTDNVMA